MSNEPRGKMKNVVITWSHFAGHRTRCVRIFPSLSVKKIGHFDSCALVLSASKIPAVDASIRSDPSVNAR